MVLQNKNAIIYGAGGSIGGAVAKAFAGAGARLFLTGRNLSSVQKLADEIIASGGIAEASEVDAMDNNAINNHLDRVIKKSGTVDISFNCIGLQVLQNMPLVDMSVDDFVRPSQIAMRSHFLTATAAGKVMMKQNSGVILSLTATPGGIGYPYTAGFAPACSAMEAFYRNLAAELGIYNIRVVNMRSAGSPDSAVFKHAIDTMPDVMAGILQKMEADTMLKKLPLMADIANVAVFLASDMAGKITGVTVDVTCGTTAALNYRVDAVNPSPNLS
ncbi:MAG TPA: SDR family oxidoreductase [Mucilaginibacter sp.]|jgi:3-oxoacyl-[acyl-carrier protein] reductase|nr:SDR family oxidoreductase [Mucilaginibacter sp.]